MHTLLLSLNIAFSVIIVILILLQGKGAGLGSAWGGGGELYQTRRGVERLTLYLAYLFIFLFFCVSVAIFFIS